MLSHEAGREDETNWWEKITVREADLLAPRWVLVKSNHSDHDLSNYISINTHLAKSEHRKAATVCFIQL